MSDDVKTVHIGEAIETQPLKQGGGPTNGSASQAQAGPTAPAPTVLAASAQADAAAAQAQAGPASDESDVDSACDLLDDTSLDGSSEEEPEGGSSDGEEESDDDSEEESDMGDGARSVGGASSVDTADLLGGDPLFLVLGQFFISKKKENLVDVMDRLNDNLEKMMKLMEGRK